MNDPAAANHFHGNAIIGIQNAGGTIHNVQINQQGAQAGAATTSQLASEVLHRLIRLIEEARSRDEVPQEESEAAIAVLSGSVIDAETAESRSKLVRLIERARIFVGGYATTAKAIADAVESIEALGR